MIVYRDSNIYNDMKMMIDGESDVDVDYIDDEKGD